MNLSPNCTHFFGHENVTNRRRQYNYIFILIFYLILTLIKTIPGFKSDCAGATVYTDWSTFSSDAKNFPLWATGSVAFPHRFPSSFDHCIGCPPSRSYRLTISEYFPIGTLFFNPRMQFIFIWIGWGVLVHSTLQRRSLAPPYCSFEINKSPYKVLTSACRSLEFELILCWKTEYFYLNNFTKVSFRSIKGFP